MRDRLIRRRWPWAVALVAVALVVTYFVTVPSPRHAGLLGPAPAAAVTTRPPTAYDKANAALDGQAAALVRHDHAGWMAAVDPAQPTLRKRFEQLYSTFLALRVSYLEYHTYLDGPDNVPTGPVRVTADLAFCLSAPECPAYQVGGTQGPPRLAQSLTLKPAGQRYVISKVTKARSPAPLQPFPWEAGDLQFAQGERVTVGASKALAGQLGPVLAMADRAARVDNQFAALMKNPQQRYRIFLATDKEYRTWYGGGFPAYTVAYTLPTAGSGMDVLLRMSQFHGDQRELRVILQHEMSHVVTLANTTTWHEEDQWLREGVADYIGWLPEHTRQDWDFYAVRDALHGGHPPKSIVEPVLSDKAAARTVDRFYGLGHFAVECMAARYGEARAMTFVRLKLRADDDLEQAARSAFGTSFGTVDKGCLSWMKQHS